MNTNETFCGLLAHTDPQKVSDLQGEFNASSAEEAQKTRCRKGAALKSWLEASEWPVSESPASFVAKIGAEGRSRFGLPSFGAAGGRAHPPFPLPNG